MHSVIFIKPAARQFPNGVQKSAFSGLTDAFAKIYSFPAKPHSSISSLIMILPLYTP